MAELLLNRRGFIKTGLAAGAALALSQLPFTSFANAEKVSTLTILHTNDWHSRIEPFPMDGGKYQGLGGAAYRAELIKQVRAEVENVVLLDSGDMFQGTPYFNFFGGELEFKLMSEMGYDVATLGNHDFDNGLEGLKKQLPHAKFSIVNANYDFSETELKNIFSPYKIIERGKIKIGVIGVGIDLQGLVPAHLYGNVKYYNPVEAANTHAKTLKESEKCDLVIVLSHLGYQYKDDKISDEVLARESRNIDLILGGHTHTFFEAPVVINNLDGKPVIINQVGWAGIMLGRLDFTVVSGKLGENPRSSMLKVSKKST